MTLLHQRGHAVNRILTLLPLALLATVPHAQQSRNRVALVNVEALVKALPGSAGYLQLATKADTDLKARQTTLQTLSARATSTRSAADRQALTQAQQAYASARSSYAKQMDTAFKPLGTKLNTAVAQVARANGISVVLDEKVAAQTSLIIYAHETTNLTSAVLKTLK